MSQFPHKRFTLTLLVILIFSFLLTSCQNTYTIKEKATRAQEIFVQLQKYTGYPNILSTLVIDPSNEINAYTSEDGISITVGMLKFCKNDSEIAFVLGHELGHLFMGHLKVDDGYDSRIHEANADKFGAFLAIRAGYDPCGGMEMWNRLMHQQGNPILTKSHPSYADRVDNLDFPMCNFYNF